MRAHRATPTRRLPVLLLFLLLETALAGMGGAARAGEPPRVGAPAPDWVFHGVDGARYRAADYLGRQGVVIAWFPKAFTPGCTTELADLRDHEAALAEYDVAILYASLDTPEENAAFAESMGADVLVVSDPRGEMGERFGVVASGGGYARRWTFYIDAEGVLRALDREVDPQTAGPDILATLERLDFPKRMSTVPSGPAAKEASPSSDGASPAPGAAGSRRRAGTG